MKRAIRAGWTIGIPTYNRYHLLKQSLASAVGQDLKPDRIIVSDNCSSDKTSEITCSDPSIDFSYFRHPSTVPAVENFRAVLAGCETEYFSWLQDDDYLFPGFGAAAIPALNRDPYAVATAGYALYGRDVDRIRSLLISVWGPPPFRMDFDHASPFSVPQHCLIPWLTHFLPGFSPVAMFRTEALRAAMAKLPVLEGYSANLFEQHIMAELNSSGSIIYLPAVLGVLRKHDIQITAQLGDYSKEQWMEVQSLFYSYAFDLMPGDQAPIESFFAEHLQSLDRDELLKFHSALAAYPHPLAQLILSWIVRYSKYDLPDAPLSSAAATGASVSASDSSLRPLIKDVLPPILYRFLHRYLVSVRRR
jgi:hypothetical protein